MSEHHNSDPLARSGSAERAYLLQRSGDHRQLAANADEPGTRMIHLRLEQLYADRAALADLVVSDQAITQKD